MATSNLKALYIHLSQKTKDQNWLVILTKGKNPQVVIHGENRDPNSPDIIAIITQDENGKYETRYFSTSQKNTKNREKIESLLVIFSNTQ